MEKTKFIDFNGEIIALFPNMKESKGCIMSYQHIGQHGEASEDFLNYPEATGQRVEELKKELKDIGYNI